VSTTDSRQVGSTPQSWDEESGQPLYFLHIPKTAGSTISRYLESQFRPDQICPARTWRAFLALPPERLGRYRFFRGHFDASLLELLPRRPAVVTMLRDPVERAVSEWMFMRRDQSHPLHDWFLREGPDFGMWIEKSMANRQARSLAIDTPPAELLHRFGWRRPGSAQAQRQSAQWSSSGPLLLERALAQLEECAAFGIVDRFDDSVELIAHGLGWAPPRALRSLNALRTLNVADEPRYEPSEAELAVLRNRDAIDFALIEHARTVFERRRLDLPRGDTAVRDALLRARRRELAYPERAARFTELLRASTARGSTVLVVSHGDDRLVAVEGRHGSHFPQAPDGGWAGYHPADSDEAIGQLEAMRDHGARYLAIPSASFWWLHHYREFTAHLEADYRRIRSSEHLVLFDMGEWSTPGGRPSEAGGERERVLVLGSYGTDRSGPPPRLVDELERSDSFAVTQRWQAATLGDASGGVAEALRDADADWVMVLSDAAVLPSGFLTDLLTAVSELLPLGVQRAQPAHSGGPDDGPSITGRIRGVLGREVAGVTPVPVLAVRRGAAIEGPVALIDDVPIRLASPLPTDAAGHSFSRVSDVFVKRTQGPERAVRRSQAAPSPLVSALIATCEHSHLLSKCLEGFCEQTLPLADFEIIVLESGGPRATAVLEEYAARLPLTWARIDGIECSAAQDLAVLLSRGDVVQSFDADHRPPPDLLQALSEDAIAMHRLD
jgi:Glycosyl transferase family 2